MKKNKSTVDVLFLLEEESETEVFAYFPKLEYNNEGLATCYAHIGQHSACSPFYADFCKDAPPELYTPLTKELESIGYKLNILNK